MCDKFGLMILLLTALSTHSTRPPPLPLLSPVISLVSDHYLQ